MSDLGELFHVGVCVENLALAMDETARAVGTGWCAPQERLQEIWRPDAGSSTVELTFVYSTEGPVRIELVQGPAGSFWAAGEHPGVHHLGYWLDDVAAACRNLMSIGWSLEVANAAPEEGFGMFAYLRSPSGLLVEPVATAARPRFEAWWTAG